uniref:ATP-binding cassette sub-family A member 2-like n=1 Tax=Solea senegalensis TaxID=28829 RepID=UPI001CD88F92
WVLAFEIFIPLVLFFILLGLRQKKPAIPVKEVSFYSAAPLTSAGIIPIMQSLCPDGQRDEFGFLQYKNSTVTQLLERISEVVEQNRLFTSDRPGLGQELEMLQKHLETLSSTPLPTDYHFNSSQGLNTQPHFDVIFVYLPGFCYRSVNSVDCTKKEPCK